MVSTVNNASVISGSISDDWAINTGCINNKTEAINPKSLLESKVPNLNVKTTVSKLIIKGKVCPVNRLVPNILNQIPPINWKNRGWPLDKSEGKPFGSRDGSLSYRYSAAWA